MKYGARPLKRAIQNKLEDLLADEILEGKIQEGSQVDVKVVSGEVRITVRTEEHVCKKERLYFSARTADMNRPNGRDSVRRAGSGTLLQRSLLPRRPKGHRPAEGAQGKQRMGR